MQSHGSRVAEPLVSAVVPTRDRVASLSLCLDALAAQTVGDRLEVIVVDDGSSAVDAVSDLVARHERALLIRQAGAGPAAARNTGAASARGTYLCFTDDDCVPHPGWAERLVEALDAGADVVAGSTLSGGGDLAEASELVAHAPAAVRPPLGSDLAFAPSNNLACRKAVFQAVPFDESYPDAAGEDREWCARVAAAGYVIRSQPGAYVTHEQELTLSGFLRQQVRYGRGAFRFRRRDNQHRPLESAAFYAALLRRGFAQGFRVGLLVSAAQVATSVGFIREWARNRRDPLAVKTTSDRASSSSVRDGS